MRRFLSLFTVLMLSGVLAFAQSRVVSGKVTDNTGKPVPFASVSLKGGKTGVTTDVNGEYSIRVNKDDVLVISQLNYDAVEVPVGAMNNVSTTLELKANTIKEVIVTSAFQTRRTLRSQSSNVQNVASEQLNTIRQSNVNNALAGKVAGIQVRSQSYGKLGVDNVVRLRGENGIAGVGGGALYVVDGTIIASANDINTDDIEDVTVLQGPAAAALFGPQGVNGAIVINTKKAKRGQRGSGLGIEINSGVQFDKVYIMPNYQNSYAGGVGAVSDPNSQPGPDMVQFHYIPGYHPAGWAALDGKYYPDYQEDESWGPRMVGQEYIPWYAWYPGTERSFKTAKLTPQPNNARDFFNTGVTKMNNVSFSKGAEGYNFRVSYTNLDQKGIIPTSYLKRNTLNTSLSVDLTSKWTVAANINYVNQKSNAENDDTYANNTSGSLNQWFHRDIDMNILREFANVKTPQGILATWNHGNPSLYNPANPNLFYRSYYWFNPYGWQNNIYNYNNRDRVFGDVSLTYKVNNDLNIKFTYRKNQLTTNSETRQYKALETSVAGNTLAGFGYWETIANRAATWQGYAFGNSYANTQNYELLGSYRKKIKDFVINANGGIVITKSNQDVFNWNSVGGLIVADEFQIPNSKSQPAERRTQTNSKGRGLFIRADLGWRNLFFVEGTFRKDYLSTEAPGFSINTKSIGASFVFSDLINKNAPTFLSYGKIRASYGQILTSLTAYQNSVTYDPTTYPILWPGGIRLVTEPDRFLTDLHGTNNAEKEIGLDLRFIKNRIGLSATYWDRTNKDFPYNATTYPGIGFTSASVNAGEVKKKGIDLQLTLNILKMKNVEWTLNATWGRLLDNKVVSIYKDIQRTLAISNGQAGQAAYVVNEVGQQWGQLVGYGFLRDSVTHQPILDGNGIYVKDPNLVHFGNVLPDYTGGFQNTLTLFKNFVINVNIDYSHGGKFFSLSKYYGFGTGLYEETATLNDKGNPIRDEVADGGGVHVFGIDETTGKPVDYYVKARDYFQQFSYGDNIAEPYIEDLTFVKLRELSLGYRIPVERLGIGKYLNSATVSIIARNPWLIYSKAKGFDPSEISTNYGEDGQLPGTRSLGINVKLGF